MKNLWLLNKLLTGIKPSVLRGKLLLNKIFGHNKCLKSILRMYHMALSFHHMCFTLHFCIKFISNACFIMLLIKPWCLNLNPFFCTFAGIVQKLTSTVLSATSFMEQSVDRTEGMYPDFPGDWDLFRFKIHFCFPSKEILIIFTFIHINSYTHEFNAALNRFFFSSQFSSGSVLFSIFLSF